MYVLFKNDWESDAKPRSPYRSCGLSLINPQNLPRLALLVRTSYTSPVVDAFIMLYKIS